MSRPVYTGCQHCARPSGVRQVRVTPRRPDVPDVGSLNLCAGCRDGQHRRWRLRYDPVEAV
jgi:hypothetical protein